MKKKSLYNIRQKFLLLNIVKISQGKVLSIRKLMIDIKHFVVYNIFVLSVKGNNVNILYF